MAMAIKSLILLVSLIYAAEALNSYIILLPKSIRPGVSENIAINIVNDLIDNATIEATLLTETGLELSKSEGNFRSNEPQTLSLKIPSDIDPNIQYQLRVQGTAGLLFINTTDVSVEAKYLSLLIQTDKGVYKAGQSVHIRCFGIHQNGSIYTGDINLEITDPKGNIIKQWKHLTDPNGVVNKTFLMDEKPVLGNWKVKASISNQTSESVFEVSEYVLPKFKTELTLPSYVMVTDKDVSGTFEAKYTYGKSVVGQLSLKVNIKGLNSSLITWNGDMYTQTMNITTTKKFTIPLRHMKNHIQLGVDTINDHINGLFLDVNATFTEDLTGKAVTKTDSIEFKNETVQIKFIKTGSSRYLPGFDYPMKVQFLDNDGRPPTTPVGDFDFELISMDDAQMETIIVNKTITVPSSGIVDVKFTLPSEKSNTEKVLVKAIYGTIFKTFDLLPYNGNETQVKLRILSSDHEAGRIAKVEIRSNADLSSILYQLVSRGTLIQSKRVDFPRKSNTQTFDIPITSSMTPSVTVLVFGMSDDGKLFADQQSISVTGMLRNKVSMSFDAKQVEPGNPVSLHVTSDPLSVVYMLATDSSSLIMSKGNDITEDRLINDMKAYSPSVKDKLFFYERNCYGSLTEIQHDKLYSAYRFEEAGTIVMTDAANYDIAHYSYTPYYDHRDLWRQMEKNCGYCCSDFTTTTTTTTTMKTTTEQWGLLTTTDPFVLQTMTLIGAQGVSGIGFANNVQTAPAMGIRLSLPKSFPAISGRKMISPQGFPKSRNKLLLQDAGFPKSRNKMLLQDAAESEKGANSAPQPIAKVKHVRTNFPETWLWTSKIVDSNGVANISSKIPDSITSWIASAFSINPSTGLGITSSKAEINVFRPFFININLPFSVIQGEEVVIQVNVFNYMDLDQTVTVTLDENKDFKNIIENDVGPPRLESTTILKTIQVKRGQSAAVYFPIMPVIVGMISLSVKAQTPLAADAVKRQLRVEPEGVAKEYNVPVIIDLSNSFSFQQVVPIEFPPSLVNGSESVQVFAIGDFMGPSVKGLDKLLTLPTGCGEQTMIGFAPNVFAYNYLKSSGQLTPDLTDKALQYMEKGYQRELKFQHDDGSFSVWGEKDPTGSTWLTAFVLKSFHQARDHIDINSEVLTKALTWLHRHQDNYDGFFHEESYVNQRSLQGGVDKTVSLTAFVTITLVECQDVPMSTNVETGYIISKARKYLEDQQKYLNDPFDIAITSYALLLAGSPHAQAGIQKLETQAIQQSSNASPKPMPECKDPPADIVFVLDSSGSIGSFNFKQILTFVKNMVGKLNFDKGMTRVGVITFSSGTYEAFPLDAYTTKSAIMGAVTRVPYYGGGTNTAAALNEVRKKSFTSSGNRTKIVIVITDGNSNNRQATKTAAIELKNTGVTAFSVGIGSGISRRELDNIASGKERVFFTKDFKTLQKLQISLGKENCQVPIQIPWTGSGISPSNFWNSPNVRANPVDIETSAYVMLYYTKSKEYIKAQNILKWIMKQRNSNGGFSSTQDTILALQAMSELVRFIHGGSQTNGSTTRNHEVSIHVEASNEKSTMNVNTDNKMVLQSFKPTLVPKEIKLSATGEGVALVQVAVDYNILDQIEKPVFILDITIIKESLTKVLTKTCTRYNGTEDSSGMSIIEHSILSGFDVDLEDVTANVPIKKKEIDDKTIYIYLDEITKKDTCVTIFAERSTMVAKVKPAPVRVYDYYKPENQVTSFYLPQILQESTYCDVCPECKCTV